MKFRAATFVSLGLLILSACGKFSAGPDAKENTGPHKDVAPHGGTPVALGDDYKLELVRDGDTGTLSGYVLDDEMEEFMRSSSPSLTILVSGHGTDSRLVLNAVGNSATGETVGDTSLFEGQAAWLRSVDSFDGTLQAIVIRGTIFTNIKFAFPKGHEND
jgi:hypothetical protein